MEIRYEVEVDDLIAFQLHHLEHDRERRRTLRFNQAVAVVLGTLCLLLALLLGSLFLLLVGLLQVPFAFPRFQRFLHLQRYRRLARKGAVDSDLGPMQLVLDETGLRFEGASKSSRLAWSGLADVQEGRDHVFLFEDPTHAWIVPKRGLEPMPGVAAFRRELDRWRVGRETSLGEEPSRPSSSERRPSGRRVWPWLVAGAAAAAIGFLVLASVAAWLLRRGLAGDNVPMDIVGMFEAMNPGTKLDVEEATAEALPAWIPHMEGVDVRGFTSKGGGLLMGTTAGPAREVLAFYTSELVAAGLEIPAGNYSETDDGGLVQARSPDGCRSVLVTVGEEAGKTQISYQFYDCSQAPAGASSAAGSWTRPLPERPPRAEGAVGVELLATFTSQEGFIRALGFSSDGLRLASASADGTIRVWDLASEEEVTRVEEPGPPNRALATALALDPEDRLLAYASRGSLFLRDLASGSSVEAMSTGASEISSLSFHGGGDLLALATLDPGGVQLLEGGLDWRPRWQAEIEGEPVEVRIGASGERLAVAGPCRGFELRDAGTGRRIDAVGGLPLDLRLCGEYFAAAFSPDLTAAANATDGPEIYRWDLARGRFLGEMTNPRGGNNLTGVTALAFAPSGGILAAGTVDRRVELWDWASQTLYGELFDVTGSDVARIVFSANGRRMAVGDWHGVVRVLEIEPVSVEPDAESESAAAP